jgi:hypothetical protein
MEPKYHTGQMKYEVPDIASNVERKPISREKEKTTENVRNPASWEK